MNTRYWKYRETAKKYREEHPPDGKKIRDKHFFNGLREKVILRDGERCLECGMSRVEHYKKWNRDITVNHINGKGALTSKTMRDNRLKNLETLCLSCHAKKDILRRQSRGVIDPMVRFAKENPKFFNRWSGRWETRK